MGSGDGRVGATTKILDNGSPSLRWNLVFLGDGYRESELAKYAADVQTLVAAIIGRAPFDTLAPAINAYRIDVVSTESGADDPTGDNGANVGSGWQSFRLVFATSDGVIYAVRSDGVLLWYRHEGWADGAIAWAGGEGAIVGHSWSFQQVVATSEGVIYGVQPDGTLRWYKHEGWADGASRWHRDSSKIVGAQVWQNFRHVAATSDGVLYGIQDDGSLLWHRHEGWTDGADRWAPRSGTRIGRGWLGVSRIMASSEGVIYAMKPDGELRWYRHEGWTTGASRWTDAQGTRVGQGWQGFLQIFVTTDSVLYGIAPDGGLLWYRHAGRDDGSSRWTGTTRDTYFDASFAGTSGGNVVDRLLVVDAGLAIDVASARVPQVHQVVVVVNSDVYGGSGGAVAVCSTDSSAGEIVIHEIGHSAFGLADEYEGGGPPVRAGEPSEPNVTRDTNRATNKWRDLILPATPMPSSCYPDCSTCTSPAMVPPAGVVGAFEGARYARCGIFRPTVDCRMRSALAFCPVCARVITQTLSPFLPMPFALLWYRHERWEDGRRGWVPGSGSRVGQSWQGFTQIVATSEGVIYGVQPGGVLFWYKHNGWDDGVGGWAPGSGSRRGAQVWQGFSTILATSEGVIYGVTARGELLWHRHEGWSDGSDRWARRSGTRVGGPGWGNFRTLVASSDGVIYGIQPGGDLLWYRHEGWADGANDWAGASGRRIDVNWHTLRRVVATSEGVLYGVETDGDLLWFRHEGWEDGTVGWVAGSGGWVGQGWQGPQHVFASSDGVIYAVQP